MNPRRVNLPLLAGFILFLLAAPSYLFFFARFPGTRDIPWANFALFAVGGVLLFVGGGRAYRQPGQYRGKVLAPIVSALSLGIVTFFAVFVFHLTKQLPASAHFPRVGTKAPEFELPDMHGKPVNLAGLLKTPLGTSTAAPKGLLLIFYRGYW